MSRPARSPAARLGLPTCSGTDKLTFNGTAISCGTDQTGAGGGAPTDAKYITQTADATLSNEQALSALATGILKNTTTTGVLSIAAAGTDYAAASHTHVIGDTTGLQAALDGKSATSHTHASEWTIARVTGSNATTTGQALANVTGLSVALLANTTYEFEAILSVQASSAAGNQYGVQFSAAGATIEAQISGTLAAATARADRISALNTAAPAYVTSGSTGGIRIQGIVTVGANAGNLTIQHLKVTSGTSTVFINSYLKARSL